MANDRDDILAEMHDDFLKEVSESGVPLHVLNEYGMPSFNPQQHLCPVCKAVIPIQNEYCDVQCGKQYHAQIQKLAIDPDKI